jgi:hypothetical protein
MPAVCNLGVLQPEGQKQGQAMCKPRNERHTGVKHTL